MKFLSELLYLLDKKEKLQAAGLFILFLFMAISEVLGIASVLPFVTILTNPESIHNNDILQRVYTFFNFESDQSFLFAVGLGVLIILILTNSVKAFTRWITLRTTHNWGKNLSLKLLKAYLSQPYHFFLKRNSADLSKNLLAEAHTVTNSVLMATLDLSTKIIVSTVILIFLAIVDPILALITAAVFTTAYAAIYLVLQRTLKNEGRLKTRAQADKFRVVNEALLGIKNIKLIGYEALYMEYFTAPATQFSMSSAKNSIIGEIPRYILEIIAFGSILVMVLYMLIQDTEGLDRILPIVALYTFAGYRLLPNLQALYQTFSRIRFHYASFKIVFDELTTLSTSAQVDHNQAEALPFNTSIQMDNVSFAYDDKNILNNANITIKRGDIIGILGKSGAGKTTFVDIILGLLKTDKGTLKTDDITLSENNIKAWQKNFSYVSQHIYLSDDTIKANIAFGIEHDLINLDRLKWAAKTAQIDTFIENDLPEKYDTIIGENGTRLSGGQRQRLGLARALYLNRPILILDEATSALDPETEMNIINDIYEMEGDKTILIITHKPSLLSRCKSLIIIENGQATHKSTDTVNLEE